MPRIARWLPVVMLAASCRSAGKAPPPSLRLTELATAASIAGQTGKPVDNPGTVLPLTGWEAGPGVTGLTSAGGALTGRSTSAPPVIHLDWTAVPKTEDTVHAIVLRMKVSAGSSVAIGFSADETGFDLRKQIADTKDWPWQTTGLIHPGDELRTIEIAPPLTRPARDLRHIMIRPTEVAGAAFTIESIRVVFRDDYLKSIPSGVSWQGLSEIYHETLVTRSPEVARFKLKMPQRPLLDFSIGTVEDTPVTFRVGAIVGETSQFGEPAVAQLFTRTVTKGHRWERAAVDLTPFSGRKITLTLSLTSETPSAVGLWGSPVVRDRGRPMEADAPQGVILVWADTLRRDHLGAYGYERPTSPSIDKLASEGTAFDACVGQATWTKVATPAMMSSLYPATNGVREFFDRLPASVTTLAEIYQRAGYATLSYSSILFTGQMTNLHQGFDELHESGSLPDQKSSKTAREFVDRLLPWLDGHRDVPFFVFLHVSDPHDPFKPLAPYDTMFNDPAKAGSHERAMESVKPFIADPLMKDFGMPTRAELVKAGLDADAYTAFNEGWYDGSIRGMDAEIGRLMERLDALGLTQKTLIVFTADHGEEFLEHGRSFHGQSVYGELNNLPLIFRRPGSIAAGRRVGQVVESIDVMPTLLALSGLRAPSELQGESLAPLLSAGPWAPRLAFSEKAETKDGNDCPPPHDTQAFSVTDDAWKLIHNEHRVPGVPEFELFDAVQDPLNLRNVASAHPDVVERLSRALTSWKSKADAARVAAEQKETDIKPEDLERLRSLGYVR
jgi:arylsulfatase A-like enzyme